MCCTYDYYELEECLIVSELHYSGYRCVAEFIKRKGYLSGLRSKV